MALGLTAMGAAVIWLGVLAPLVEWHADRDETLRRQRALAHRMAALVETLPALRGIASEAGDSGQQTGALLAAETDPLAASELQQKLDALATASGVRIGSEEILPVQADGNFRAIAVRVTLTAPFRSVVALLKALAEADVPMMADELQLRGPTANSRDGDLPIDANFTVTAYRAAAQGTR